MILPETASKTGGYCMPCEQKKAREEREQYIRENIKNVDLYSGIKDPVELIKIFHQKLEHDPLIHYIQYKEPIENVYQTLTESDEARLVKFCIEQTVNEDTDLIESICLELAAFKNSNLTVLHDFMMNEHIYYPSMVFKNSTNSVVNTLLTSLESDSENRNLILLALAWADGDIVEANFTSWKKKQPRWSKDLYIPPQDYSREAGWEIDSKNQKRLLFLEPCFSLAKTKKPFSSETFESCTSSGKHCEWCNRKLTNLLKLDLSDSLFSNYELGLDKINITTCDACACYSEAIFMDLDDDGDSKWSNYNTKPEYLPDDQESWEYMPENCLNVSNTERPADYAANEFLPTSFSQIGGMPTWIQDSAYPSCPSCQKTMKFIAQISNEDIDEYGEGMYYSYICSDCKITATNYQQT
jgi:hypothetical protein